jgi:beta-glucosidase
MTQAQSYPFQDARLSIDERVEHLVSAMTIEEKVAQLWGMWVIDIIEGHGDAKKFSTAKAVQRIPHGVGHLSRIGGAAVLVPELSATLANSIQRYLVEQTRLGIPAIVHEESCAGYLGRGATTFPQAIGLAATWEPELIRKMADVIRQQMRAVGAHHALAPVLDVCRDPRFGRTEETYGEDPFLISAVGTAYIQGIQGADPRNGVAATAKHFVGYAMSEGGMNWAPAHIPARELREVYAMPFKAAIQQARIATVMNAYHEHDGVPAGSSVELLQDLLRHDLGFDGIVASDYFTLNMFFSYHKIAQTKEDAARMGLKAGIDAELPTVDCYGEPLLAALKAGTIDSALVEASLRRVLRLKFQLGLFENPYVDAGRAMEVYNTPDQLALSRELVRKSMVLLKNEYALLPLSKALNSIAVIGPSADSVRLLQGDYHYPSHLEGIFDPEVRLDEPAPAERARLIDWSAHFPPSTTILAGIKAAVSSQTAVHYARGCDTTGNDTAGFEAAVTAAKHADVAVVVVGDKSGLALGCTSGESIDSATLELPGVQQDLIEAIHATGTPVVVVLLTGRPYAIPWIAEHIPAVIQAWLPAQEGGAGIADILFGDANPGGRLPISIPRHVGQVPVYYAHKPSGGRTHWQGEYMDLPTTPLYPFGHGLSYTQFSYSDLDISPTQIGPNGIVSIALTLKNVGTVAGDEVVQLYIHDEVGSVTRPVQELKGFIRLKLSPDESRRLTFDLDVRHVAFYDRAMRYVVEPGVIEVQIGSSCHDVKLSGTFTITGAVTTVDQVFSTPVRVE